MLGTEFDQIGFSMLAEQAATQVSQAVDKTLCVGRDIIDQMPRPATILGLQGRFHPSGLRPIANGDTQGFSPLGSLDRGFELPNSRLGIGCVSWDSASARCSASATATFRLGAGFSRGACLDSASSALLIAA